MKKFFISLAVVALALTSCSTVNSTATVMDVPTQMHSFNEADLQVSDKCITYTYVPTKEVQRGGEMNVRRMAVAEALQANGGGDVLVQPNYQTTVRRGLLSKKVKKVVVTGHVGTYKNFRPAKPCCKK
uniref:hypothetical protein n=1 Tax=Alloprevotella sp. TaxID=1872471 RepID=UPI0015ABAE02